MNLKEWAEKLNNMEYRSDSLLENDKQLKEDGVVAVVGASDDLCELYGAIHDEYDCYNGTILYWNGKDFFTETQKDDFLGYVDNEYPEFFEMCQKLFKDDVMYIKISDGRDCQFEYETNIPCEWFNVMEDGELYCKGFIFNKNDLKM